MDDSKPNEITGLLLEWRQGDQHAKERLLPLVYNELRRLAQFHMRNERRDHTLQPTALVHEAYVRMVNLELTWKDRVHFFSMAARTMRHILVDHARALRSTKRGGSAIKVELDDEHLRAAAPSWDIVDLDRALTRLKHLDDKQSEVVELHYFGGLSYDEIAEAMHLSRSTVSRELRHAKLWLRRELSDGTHGR